MADFYQDQITKRVYQVDGMKNTGGGIMRLHIYSNFEPKESIMLNLDSPSDMGRYLPYERPKHHPPPLEKRVKEL